VVNFLFSAGLILRSFFTELVVLSELPVGLLQFVI
jgi:hypothetical protein